MRVETARVFFGIAAALATPWGADWHRTRPASTVLFVGLYGAYGIAPYVGEGRAWSAWAAAVLVAVGSVLFLRIPGASAFGFSLSFPLTTGPGRATRRAGMALVSFAVLMGLWTAGGRTKVLSAEFVLSDRVSVFLSALLLAVFGGGALASLATASVRAEVDALPPGQERDRALDFMSGSRTIGLLERGLLFAFIGAGQPEAAALVLAAKSLARVPTNDHGKHASEYFLIGTLASVIASLAMGMAARSAVGLPTF
ncbi:hypothetical protein [Streptomyces sp. NBC_00102]|uniref:hypothetical protein n=1 Tax=Streptomyces sp. NBC_00102 TaxID=2975652 RepID=UPI0022574925|nr:hypothetical protein [Streptomyces sp. NBC_00102]MCX5397546.1 hypothetical protein [Streptomyces sp. NBC_00102]